MATKDTVQISADDANKADAAASLNPPGKSPDVKNLTNSSSTLSLAVATDAPTGLDAPIPDDTENRLGYLEFAFAYIARKFMPSEIAEIETAYQSKLDNDKRTV